MTQSEFVINKIVASHATDSLTASEVYQAWLAAGGQVRPGERATSAALGLMTLVRTVHGVGRDKANVLWGLRVRTELV